MFKKSLLVLVIAFSTLLITKGVRAQSVVDLVEVSPTAAATDSSDATPAARIASPSAEVQQKIQERKDSDITDPEGGQKGKLSAFLDTQDPGPLSWNNFLEHAIRYAVGEGVPPNIIVLVLLFPLIASFIAASRHIVGLRGFGLYIPAVLSVALVSTGVFEGLIIFLAIVTIASFTKKLLTKSNLAYLPRTALLLWTISLGIFGLLLAAPIFNLVNLMSVNIFPILILVLLAENFLDAQARTKQADAITLTIETISLAFISGLILKWELMQRFALTDPELLLAATAALDIIVGKFAGLRVNEFFRFRSIIEEEE